jgi:hypothetical protein
MASAYLSRTFASPTNASKFTYSAWVKRSALNSSYNLLFANGGNSQNFANIMFNGSDNFFWHVLNSNSEVSKLTPNRKCRDTSGWYHLVFQWDSTQATATNRTKMYINGEQLTSFGTQTNTAQNTNYYMNTAVEHIIGAEKGNTGGSVGNYFDGEMAHVHFVDGTIYAPSTFGETDATTGIWKPKTSPGISTSNYGNNGFWLKFDNSGNMGLDSSGNSNNWTTSGTIIQNKDTPSNVFATLNTLGGLNGSAKGTYSNTNTTWVSSTTDQDACNSTLPVNGGGGKYYCEMKCVSKTGGYYNPGVFSAVSSAYNSANPSVFVRSDGVIYNNGSQTQSGLASVSNGDIFGMAYDASNATHTIQFYLNGSTYGSAENITNAPGYSLFFGDGTNSGSVSNTVSFNFGSGYFGTTAVSSAQNPDDGIGIFEYSVPSGFRALCTKSFNAQEYS